MFLLSSGANIICHSAGSYEEIARCDISNPVGLSAYLVPTVSDISWSTGDENICCSMVVDKSQTYILRVNEERKKFVLRKKLPLSETTTSSFTKTQPEIIGIGTSLGEVYIYDCDTSDTEKTFRVPSAVDFLDFSSNDKYVAAAIEKEVFIFNRLKSLPIKKLKFPYDDCLTNLRFHPNRPEIIGACSDNGGLILWDVSNNNPKHCSFYEKLAHVGPCTDLAFSYVNENLLATVGFDRIISGYDTRQQETVLTILAHKPIQSVDLNTDGISLAIGDVQGGISIYDPRNYTNPYKVIDALHIRRVKKILYRSNANSDRVDTSVASFKGDGKQCRSLWHILGSMDDDMNIKYFPSSRRNNYSPCNEICKIGVVSVPCNKRSEVTDSDSFSEDSEEYLDFIGYTDKYCKQHLAKSPVLDEPIYYQPEHGLPIYNTTFDLSHRRSTSDITIPIPLHKICRSLSESTFRCGTSLGLHDVPKHGIRENAIVEQDVFDKMLSSSHKTEGLNMFHKSLCNSVSEGCPLHGSQDQTESVNTIEEQNETRAGILKSVLSVIKSLMHRSKEPSS